MLKDEIQKPQEEIPLVINTPLGKKMIPISGIEVAQNIWGSSNDRRVEKNITENIIKPEDVRILDVSDRNVVLSMKETDQVITLPLTYFPDYEG